MRTPAQSLPLALAALMAVTLHTAACSPDGSGTRSGRGGAAPSGSGGSTPTGGTSGSGTAGAGIWGQGGAGGTGGGAGVGGSDAAGTTGTAGSAAGSGGMSTGGRGGATGGASGNGGNGGNVGTSGSGGSSGSAGSAGRGGVGVAGRGGASGTAGGPGGAVAGSGGGGGGGGGAGGDPGPTGTPTVLTDDGGWCWFQQPRALFYGTRMIVASLAAGWNDASVRGNPRAVVYDFSTAKAQTIDLHSNLELDDHDAPAFMVRTDGRILAVYEKHDSENHFYYRISDGADGLTWGAERTFTPSTSSSLTYANVFRLPGESNRVYNFFRGIDGSFKPSYATSDDEGQTWKKGNVVIDFTSGTTLQRPYVRYVSNGTDTVHFIYTEAHPRDYDTSLYHMTYKGGSLYASDGTRLAALTQGITATQGTRIYKSDANHVAWGSDVVLDGAGRPFVTYSVQMNSAGLPVGQGGDDIRYRYARWDGTAWRDYALAYAGSRLYSGEDDYSGLATLDPDDISVVYLSTNADPVTGTPLKSAADGKRHYEIYRGVTADQGSTWAFTPITHDSTSDNLRPLLPHGGDGHQKALLWLRGVYRKYTDYQQQVVALFWRR
jgi:hypothetical protein